MVLNFVQGNVNDNIDFKYDEGSFTVEGCGTVFMGEYWYFGGYHWDRVSICERQSMVHSLGYLKSPHLDCNS